MKDIMTQQGLYNAFVDKKPEDVKDPKWEDMERHATLSIGLALAPEIKYDVLKETKPKELWDKLEKVFQSKSLVSKLFLRKNFFGLEMDQSKDFTYHIMFNKLITQLVKLDEMFKDEDKTNLLLVSLSIKFNTVITSLLVGKTTLTLDEMPFISRKVDEARRRIIKSKGSL